MKSVLFFIECLDMGGAETILTNIISKIDKSKYDITVVSEKDKEFHTDEIKRNCRHRSFIKQNRKTKVGKFWNLFIIKYSLVAPEKWIRKSLIRGKYDIEIAFCEGYSTKIIGNSLNNKSKKIAWVHTDVLNYPWSESVYGSCENEKNCYDNFDKIVCVSNTIKDSFVKKYGMEKKTEIIYNAIDFDLIKKKSKEPIEKEKKNGYSFISVGSFKKIKGYDRLVDVCSKLKNENYSFNLTIIGSGSEYASIENKIKELSLENDIKLMDYNPNPYKYITQSDALICSSYAEGYSTTVTEAIVLGVPVITTECSGMREIFGDKECGIICENSEEGLYNALKSVLDNPECLKAFAKNASERAKDFDMKKRVAEVESFLDSL